MSHKYGTKRANISPLIDKGVKMCYRAATNKFLLVAGLLVELITFPAKPKGYLEAYTYII